MSLKAAFRIAKFIGVTFRNQNVLTLGKSWHYKNTSGAKQIQMKNNLRPEVKVKEYEDLLHFILEKLVQNQFKFLPSGKMNHGMLQISMKM